MLTYFLPILFAFICSVWKIFGVDHYKCSTFFFSVAFFRVWKRRLLMCLLSFIELSCIRTLNGHHTRHHSMFYDIFVVKEKKIYAKEFTRWISDFWCEVQRICLNEKTVNWLSFGIVLFSAIFICAIYFFMRILLCCLLVTASSLFNILYANRFCVRWHFFAAFDRILNTFKFMDSQFFLIDPLCVWQSWS